MHGWITAFTWPRGGSRLLRDPTEVAPWSREVATTFIGSWGCCDLAARPLRGRGSATPWRSQRFPLRVVVGLWCKCRNADVGIVSSGRSDKFRRCHVVWNEILNHFLRYYETMFHSVTRCYFVASTLQDNISWIVKDLIDVNHGWMTWHTMLWNNKWPRLARNDARL